MRPRWLAAVVATIAVVAVVALVVWLLLLRGAALTPKHPTVAGGTGSVTPRPTSATPRPSAATTTAKPTTVAPSVATLAPSWTPTPTEDPIPVPAPTVTVTVTATTTATATATTTASPSPTPPPWLPTGSCARLGPSSLTTADCTDAPGSPVSYAVAAAGTDGAACPAGPYVRYQDGRHYACLIPRLVAGTCYAPDPTIGAAGALRQVACTDPTARFAFVGAALGRSVASCGTGQAALIYAVPEPGLVFCTKPPA